MVRIGGVRGLWGRRPAGAGERLPARTPLVVAAVLVLSLLGLVLVAVAVLERSARVRATLDAAERARRLATVAELALAREVAALDQYLLTGDATQLERFREARREGALALSDLDVLARGLGGEVVQWFGALRRAVARWHARSEALVAGRISVAEFAAGLQEQHARFEEALRAAFRLEAAIARVVAAQRETLRVADRMQLGLTVLLVLVALGATGAVTWTAWRFGETARRMAWLAREQAVLAERLQRVMESRSRLIRGFSHDLKNPLSAALGYVQLLEEGALGSLEPRQREAADRMRRSLEAALKLVDDLLEFERAEAGRIELAREPVDVRQVVQDVVEEYRAAAEAEGLRVRAAVPPELPAIVSDAARVRQILWNLVSNAIKYTPAGGSVEVRARLREGGPAPGAGRWLAVEVADTGPGIPAELRERIFEEFARVGPGPGAGLGLAISRHLARALGGDLTVESEVGRGSTFTLWLPVRPPAA